MAPFSGSDIGIEFFDRIHVILARNIKYLLFQKASLLSNMSEISRNDCGKPALRIINKFL